MNRKLAFIAVGLLASVSLTACVSSGPDENTAQGKKAAVLEDMQKKWDASNPYPASDLGNSIHRKNLAERLKRTNKADYKSYLYVFSAFSPKEPYGYYIVQGGVTAVAANMFPDDLIIDACGQTADYCPEVVGAPNDEGVAGESEGGVFFFDANDRMVTLSAGTLYQQSDAPLPFNNIPQLNPNK